MRPSAGVRAGSISSPLPALALTFNAFVWGTSWWPFRHLEARGVHPLWATALIFTLATTVLVVLRPRAVGQLVRTPALWLLLLAAGVTNASFNWGVTIGDVVRVILLFYLMPLWTALLARLLLGEPLTAAAGVRVLLAMAGAGIVLWPAADAAGAGGWAALPIPRSLADWLGVGGGFSFALNNVLLKREAARPQEGRALAMFFGAALVAGGLALALTRAGLAPAPPPPQAGWVALAAAMGVLLLGSNLALQYGAGRLAANVTSVVMLSEVLFASVSALALGGGRLTMPLLAGGGLILLSTLLAAFAPAER